MPRSRVSSTIEVHHRLLRGDVEAGGRLVGDQQLRPAGERERDHDALAHAAGQLERIGVVALARARDAHLVEDLDRLVGERGRSRPGHAAAARPRSGGRPCGSGLSAARGFWKIIDISRPRRSRISSSLARAHVEAGEMHRAFGDAPGAVEDAHHRVGGDRLAGAGLADDADGLALGDADVDVLDRAHDAAPGRELDGEVLTSSSGTAVSVIAASFMVTSPLRIDDVAQAVAEQVEAEHRDHQRGAGEERDPPFARDHEGRAFGHHDPPFRASAGARRAR